MKRDDDRGSSRRPYRAERANEYEEFGGSPGRGSAGLEGGRRDRDGYGDSSSGGYGGGSGGGYSGNDSGARSLPRRESREDRPSSDRSTNDRSTNDRSTNDRPSRRNSGDDDFARGRDDGFGNEPRSIPERSSRPARDGNDASDRPRRRRSNNEETDRPRRRSSQVEDVRGNNDDIPAADYAEFTPLEIKPEKPAGSSWGPGG
jgi:hypothetical protein